MLRYSDLYKQVIKQQMQQKFAYKNVHQIPKILKIVINMGVGESVHDSKVLNNAIQDLNLISGQKPLTTIAKNSIATFKLRAGMKIGCKVTLRGERMYDFLERLVLTALPRVKEFKGFSSKSFDKFGNFSFGIKEQIVFPEISYDKVDAVRGMDITIVTTADNKLEAKTLLEYFNLPFYS